MCGICGELRFDGLSADPVTLEHMLARLEHRGPDNEGKYLGRQVALGHRRLSIIDLSAASNQPMLDHTLGLALVFNGTIYNYKELRAELEAAGQKFSSQGDTEVILRAYAEWGDDFVPRLSGMFAFTIWDMRRKRLFMARDRFGIKPLYYSLSNDFIRFASTTQALLAAGDIDRGFDTVALHHHFTLHAVVPAPRTLIQGIRKLPPAHIMIIEADGKHQVRPYWQLDSTTPEKELSEWEWVEAIHESLERAIKRRRQIADVPVGVLLSGGLDSSLLVALLAEHGGANDLLTFSVGFEDDPLERGNEFEFSDRVADRYNTLHHKLRVPNREILEHLPDAIDFMNEPMASQDAIAFYLLSQRVSKYVKVVQSGQGADEVFGGYFWYPQMDAARGTDLQRFHQFYFDRDHDEYLKMVQTAYQGEDHTSAYVEKRLQAIKSREYLNRVLHLDVTTLIVDDPVKRVDNMTMAWGLEARVPFLDHELVELVAAMPVKYKIGSGGKHLLKRISRGLVPDEIIDRPKAYFPVPALKYVRGRFLEFMRDILNSKACRERGIYQQDYVDALLKDPEHNLTRIQGNKLWHLTALEYWLQRNLDAITP